jgi:hypothetical protein
MSAKKKADVVVNAGHASGEGSAHDPGVLSDGEDGLRATGAAQDFVRERLLPRTTQATAAVTAKGEKHRARAQELRAHGLSAPQVGIRMAREDGRDTPYGERQVRRWWSAASPEKG